MTDKELLELAAKAMGIHGLWVDAGLNIGSNEVPHIWNPLHDDGSALRLAVNLGIDLLFNPRPHIPSTLAAYGNRELHGDDPCAATRRAIVRAAAEVEIADARREVGRRVGH